MYGRVANVTTRMTNIIVNSCHDMTIRYTKAYLAIS